MHHSGNARAALPLSRAFASIASRPLIAGVLICLVAVLLAAAASAAHGFPPPGVHDEFSYLLGAETFASGRLTNPTHPMSRYFETFHVLQQPTYNSKYPPANALFLASGLLIGGKPIVGVWVSFAFMSVAIFWMLRAWVGERWGLGLALASTSWIAASYWTYTLWGGAVAAGAGALMFGAMYRIVERRGGAGTAVSLGVGLVLLANSRPLEGVLISIPAALVFLRWLFRDRKSLRGRMMNVMLPLAAVLAIGAAAMGMYFNAVTGSWHRMPYSVYSEARDATPKFIWQKPIVVPVAEDPSMRRFGALEDTMYRRARTPFGRVTYARFVISDFLALVVPVGLLVPLLLIPFAWRSRRTRFAVVAVVWTLGAMGLSTFFLPHYAAPVVGLVLAVYGGCLRWLSRLRTGEVPAGKALAVATLVLWFIIGIGNTAITGVSRARGSTNSPLSWPRQRQLIADTLSHNGKKNLVIVRYGPTHSPNGEWVWNSANIDAAPIVWARDLGDAGNEPLLQYYRDRAAWLITVNGGKGPYRVEPYR